MSSGPARPSRHPTRLWTALLVASSALLAWRPIATADLFFHLSLGRAVWRSGARVVSEPTAFAELAGPRVVPQWLWDVGAYGLYEHFGPNALVLFTMAVAALATWLLCRLVSELSEGGGEAAAFLVAGLGSVAIGMRMSARPQAMFMLLLVAAMSLAWTYSRALGRRRVVLGACFVALTMLWAQLHGSFVLAPVVWALIVVPAYLEDRAAWQHWRLDAAVLAGSAAALGTTAYGVDFLPYVLSHASSDAVRHNLEMQAPSWASLTGTLLPSAMWALALFGPVRGGRIRWRELGLFALGVALAMSAARFKAAATLLSVPLALCGAQQLDDWLRGAWRRARNVLAPGVAFGLVAFAGFALADTLATVHGPIGRGGLNEGAHPLAAWQYLRSAPAGTNTLADYGGGSALAYFADGHLRTFVDGRTPLHFDDTQFAVYRDMGAHAKAMSNGLARYDIRAAVVDRNWSGCSLLARRWTPVVIEARYTTFVPRGSAMPLAQLEACGSQYLKSSACEHAEQLGRSIERLRKLDATSFVDFLRADSILRCGGSADEAARLLPAHRDAFAYAAARERTEILLELAREEWDGAAERLQQAVELGDGSALEILLLPSAQSLGPERTRAILEAAVLRQDDDARPAIRTALADRCRALGDVECVRFHALRAAIQGYEAALPLVRWAAANHPDEGVRKDLQGWLERLSRGGQMGAPRL